MYASKVMPICPKCGKAVRVRQVEDGKMVRVCKKCGLSCKKGVTNNG